MKHLSKIFTFLTFILASASSLAEPWNYEFAEEHFGANSDYSTLERAQNSLSRGDYGRAVLEIESILANGKSNISSFARVRSYLFRNSAFTLAIFRATELSGIDYYKCVFGNNRAKKMLSKRLELYGDALTTELQKERTLAVEKIPDSRDGQRHQQDCSEQRKQFTSIWTKEVDSTYLANEKVIQNWLFESEKKIHELKIADDEKAESERREAIKLLEQTKKIRAALRKQIGPNSIALGQLSVYEYGRSTGLRVSALNLSTKAIKYLDFGVVGVNAVGDTVTDALKGRTLKFRAIGPIKEDEYASYSEDVMWFTDIVDHVKIVSLKVTFMDGSVSHIKNPMKTVLTDEEVDILRD